MKALKKEKVHKPLSLSKKILLFLLCLAAVIGLIYFIYYFIHYYSYNEYEKYLTDYSVEEGTEFTAINETVSDVEGMVLASQNDSLKLYVNTESGEIAVYDKRNGQTIYSNPAAADDDPIANARNLNYLKSQFIVDYYNSEVTAGSYDSYSMSVEKGKLNYEGIVNGIRFIYDVGEDTTSGTGTVPVYITEEKLAELVEKLGDNGTTFSRYYVSSSLEGMLEMPGATQKNVKTIQKLQGWLDEIGWTEEDFNEQQELAGAETISTAIAFKIPVEYRLEEDGLRVSIPTSEIEEQAGSIYRIQLLRYMGAASDSEDGYMVVPNGSGSIIYFNNGKTSASNYSQYVYGLDPLASDYTQLENLDDARLPLFGICRSDSSILVTIEDGKTLANITAGVSGSFNSYNYAYTAFVVRAADALSMFGDTAADVYVLEDEIYDVNLTVKYTFLTEENSGYSGIANYYRERLLEEGVLALNEEAESIPLYYDIIGSGQESRHFLGIQYSGNFAMTTFEQAGTISDELAEAGISNQVMNFQGWFNDGYNHNAADEIKVVSKLGGTSGLEALNETVSQNGGSFYVDVAFQEVTYADDGFNYSEESSKYYGGGYVASFGLVNPTNLRNTSGLGYAENLYNLLSPKYLPRYVDKFASKIVKYDIDGISLRDLGDELHSDKKRTNVINREEALSIVEGQLQVLDETGKSLMMSDANSYAFTYASDIINVPITDNDFYIVDEDIPLYQMIIHGSIYYSTELLNYDSQEDKTESVLNMIEHGASPHYVFTYEESSRMKDTALNRYYSTTWDVWKDEAISIYNQVNEALSHVTGAVITNHEILESGVRKITYSNDVIIYVNYNNSDVIADGKTITANSYALEGVK